MKQTGIWLDFNEAYIIKLTDGEVSTETIVSEIEHGKIKGGSRSKTPWGPMEKTSESKFLERRKQQTRQYFETICQSISEVDEFFIMGPAEAKIGLQKHIENSAVLQDRLLAVQTVDSMTNNQKIAIVKAFFADR
jgi:hypothetical protein